MMIELIAEWLGSVGGIVLFFVLLIFLTLYLRGVFRERRQYHLKNVPAPDAESFGFTVACLSDSFISCGKVTGFWVEAERIYAARFDAIAKAKESIQFETFIILPGDRADQFAEAIVKKSREGVKVQVLIDDFGTQSLPKSYWKNLEDAGVEVRFFNEFSWKDILYHLKRNHRKLLLIDGNVALVGGAGFADDWDGKDKNNSQVPWLDYEVRYQGPVVTRLQGIFLQHWLDAGGTADFTEHHLCPHESDEEPIIVTAGEDPSYRDSGIRALFQSLIAGARRRIWIASPYFLPDPNSRELLLEARKRGVEIRILTMGKRCDKPYVHYTSRELYPCLLKGGIEIYEYQPSMMHAKVLLIDEDWVSMGSANFDPRSFFQNEELNLTLRDRYLAEPMESLFLGAFEKSYLANWKDWKKRPLKERAIGRFSLLFYWQL
ncbi:phosphatidylserine/phosphatidylglycerophosphate/cardiolipin synthase family protein [Lyngbya sp. CCY1209]|jgi:cardiolipin synthase|uniref:phospholipase D-like domain-containing protein n=1 Tax=Lyngbya sp. CCY1209 TaxID=2886103 RepID=UPI002D2059A7|nr:phosphatidylserine/phosphatidylglycerophosphate/cardiolipin synthase family protein [Lyngbya sp. CCY1209]MEB3886500.1 phosphatidylserine/phosphatidylglycerophosphate/cardiolipin synthase family protein [Lyngbya sp. CCY1209]